MLDTITSSIAGLLEVGGPVVAVLLLASVFFLALVLLKLWQYLRLGMFSPRIDQLRTEAIGHWQRGEYGAVGEKLPAHPQGGVPGLLQAANQLLAGRSVDGPDLVDELTRAAQVMLANLRSHLRSMEVIANLAPLVGLLGTVIGMIEAFQAMEQAGKQVDPSVLSGGIWVALLTTAVGLIVAIPATLAHNWFDRRVERCAESMQDTIGQIATLLAIESSPRSPSAELNVRKFHSASA